MASIIPGTKLPSVSLPLVSGGRAELGKVSAGKSGKLLVIYRGQFCPFCQMTLKELQTKVPTLEAAGWELVAASADKEPEATAFAAAHALTFPIAYGLTEPDLAKLGTYVSDPTDYIPQKHAFGEPAYFVLDPDSTVRYTEKGSFPAGGRPNVDNILAAFGWATQNAKDHPEFKGYFWGTKTPKAQ